MTAREARKLSREPTIMLFKILASTYGPGPHGPGPYGPGSLIILKIFSVKNAPGTLFECTLLQEHICYMLLEQYTFQIWSCSMFEKYDPGTLFECTLLHEHVCYLLLEKCAFQIWSWTIFDLQYSSNLSIIPDHMVLEHYSSGSYGPGP